MWVQFFANSTGSWLFYQYWRLIEVNLHSKERQARGFHCRKSRSRCSNWSHTHKPFVSHSNTSFETFSLDGRSKYEVKLKENLKNDGWYKHSYTCSFGTCCLLLSSRLHSTYELENQSQTKSCIILVIMRQLVGSSPRHRVCRQHSSFQRNVAAVSDLTGPRFEAQTSRSKVQHYRWTNWPRFANHYDAFTALLQQTNVHCSNK